MRNLLCAWLVGVVVVSCETTTTAVATTEEPPDRTSGFFHFQETQAFNCPDAPFAETEYLDRGCGDESNPCPVVVKEDFNDIRENTCGKLYRIAIEQWDDVSIFRRQVFLQVVHQDPFILPGRFGFLRNGWREVCPYACISSSIICKASPLDCGARAVAAPSVHGGDSELMLGTAVVGPLDLPYEALNDPDDFHGIMPDPLPPATSSLLVRPQALYESDLKSGCENDGDPYTFEEAIGGDKACGATEDEPCLLLAGSESGLDCGECYFAKIYITGVVDRFFRLCDNGTLHDDTPCTPYVRELYFMTVARSEIEGTSISGFAAQSAWSQLCPHLCLKDDGQPSGVCVLHSTECRYGTAPDEVIAGGSWWPSYVRSGSLDRPNSLHILEFQKCSDLPTTTTTTTGTSSSATRRMPLLGHVLALVCGTLLLLPSTT